MAVAPAAAERFARDLERLGPFEPEPLLAIACSGGADSSALTLLAQGWAESRGGRVLALILDHGLRPGSAGESALTAERLQGRGIEARTLRWADPPSPGSPALQASARAARRLILAEAAHGAGALHLLLGHHAGDQAETVAARAARAAQGPGLAGMAALREDLGLRWLRPLLGWSKESLQDVCRAAGLDWIEDPTNADPRFERTRWRQAMAPAGSGRWLHQAAEAAARRQAQEAAAESLLLHAVVLDPGARLRLDLPSLEAAEPEIRRAALAWACRLISQAPHPPPAASLDRLWQGLSVTGAGRSRGLGGVLWRRLGSSLLLWREARHLPPIMVLPAGEHVTFDQRWQVRAEAPGWQIGHLPRFGLRAPRAEGAGWPQASRQMIPVLARWENGLMVGTLAVDAGFGPLSRAGLTVRLRPGLPLLSGVFVSPLF